MIYEEAVDESVYLYGTPSSGRFSFLDALLPNKAHAALLLIRPRHSSIEEGPGVTSQPPWSTTSASALDSS
jgi:hypothetical protein